MKRGGTTDFRTGHASYLGALTLVGVLLVSPARGLERSSNTGGLPGSVLLLHALEASGSDAPGLWRYQPWFAHYLTRLDAELTPGAEPRQVAETIHQFMHREILRGPYQASGSNLASTLDGGAFNCLTASVVYLALADACGLEAQAVATSGHVWCRVATPRGVFDVETTCPEWFELLTLPAKGRTPATAKLLDEHAQRQRTARPIEERALVAMFHYNRGVRLLNRGEFAGALEANLEALELDPDSRQAYDNLLATINNWSVALVSEGQRAEGMELLSRGLTLAPEYRPFQQNQRILTAPSEPAPRPAGGP